jgi:hypothetical protein
LDIGAGMNVAVAALRYAGAQVERVVISIFWHACWCFAAMRGRSRAVFAVAAAAAAPLLGVCINDGLRAGGIPLRTLWEIGMQEISLMMA